jgi:hypothetical protein
MQAALGRARAVNLSLRSLLARPELLAAIGAVCLLILLVAMNIFVHTLVVVGTAETDSYFWHADALLRGEAYSDPYHPPLYTLGIVGVSLAVGHNTFLAGKLISSFAISVLIGLTYLLARFFVRPQFSLLTTALVALDMNVFQHGLLASTDALYTTLCIGVLLIALTPLHNPARWGAGVAIALGMILGLAYLTRYTAIFLVGVVGYSLWRTNDTRARRWRLGGMTALSAVAVMLPWLIYNARSHGSPFANENWRNFALALYGNGDYTYLRSTQYTGYLDIFMSDPANVLLLWSKNLVAVAKNIPLYHSGSPLLALFLPFGLISLTRNDKCSTLLLIYVAACILPVVAFFTYMQRLMLPVTPVVILIAIIGLDASLRRLAGMTLPIPHVLGVLVRLFVIVIVLWPTWKLIIFINTFADRQPTQEVRMLNQLADNVLANGGKSLKIVSTYQHIAYFSKYPDKIQRYWVPYYNKDFSASLLDTVAKYDAEYVLISDGTAGGAIRSGLIDRLAPTCWIREREDHGATGSIRLYKNECHAPISR